MIPFRSGRLVGSRLTIGAGSVRLFEHHIPRGASVHAGIPSLHCRLVRHSFCDPFVAVELPFWLAVPPFDDGVFFRLILIGGFDLFLVVGLLAEPRQGHRGAAHDPQAWTRHPKTLMTGNSGSYGKRPSIDAWAGAASPIAPSKTPLSNVCRRMTFCIVTGPLEHEPSAILSIRCIETATQGEYPLELPRRKHAPLSRSAFGVEDLDLKTERMVPRGGFEPPTRGFSVRCSTN